MTGEQLYQSYQQAAERASIKSAAAEYAQLLRTAKAIVGKAELYAMLETAEATDQQLDLTFPIPFEVGPSDPCGIHLVPRG